MGELAALQLLQRCPAGNSLLVRAAMLSSGLPQGLAPAEQALLQPVAQAVCQHLETAYNAPATSPRSQLLQAEMRRAILANYAGFKQYYGVDVLGENEVAEQVGHKLGVLLLAQCPRYLMLASQDEQAARPAPAAPAQPPVRRAAGH